MSEPLSPPNTAPSTINLLTLNCWGLKYISKARSARLSEIGRTLASTIPTPHIVGLQECWTFADYLSIRRATRHNLPYGKFYHSGIFGGGLAILSAWPIIESTMFRYPLNGRPTAFYRGDWFVGKGVACARIRYGGDREVMEVFCTHLHAPYNEGKGKDSYACHRTSQAWEIAKLMRGAAERGHLVVGLGDFNILPLSLPHLIIETYSPVHDIWRLLHPTSSLGASPSSAEQRRNHPIPTAAFNLHENGTTCDSVLNTWRWSPAARRQLRTGKVAVDPTTPDPLAQRLDYIFASCGPASDWHVAAARVGMTERHPALGCSLSDHFAVEATLARGPAAHASAPAASSPAQGPATSPLLPTLSLIATYTARQRRQRRLFLSLFLLSVPLTIALFIYTPLVLGWWNLFVVMLSTLGLSAGVVCGLIGGLFVGSELRALKEFEWEVRCALRAEGVEGGGEGGEGGEEGEEGVKDWWD